MRQARRSIPALVVLVAMLLVAPAGVLAGGGAHVTGTVVRDGSPVAGVSVVVAVAGGDQVVSATSDEQGSFSLDVDAEVGAELDIYATGKTSRSDPDRDGCVRSETPVGQATATIDALPPSPLTVELDQVLTSKVCGATGRPDVTPPSTDSAGLVGGAGSVGGGLLIVLGLLSLLGAGLLVTAPRRRS